MIKCPAESVVEIVIYIFLYSLLIFFLLIFINYGRGDCWNLWQLWICLFSLNSQFSSCTLKLLIMRAYTHNIAVLLINWSFISLMPLIISVLTSHLVVSCNCLLVFYELCLPGYLSFQFVFSSSLNIICIGVCYFWFNFYLLDDLGCFQRLLFMLKFIIDNIVIFLLFRSLYSVT